MTTDLQTGTTVFELLTQKRLADDTEMRNKVKQKFIDDKAALYARITMDMNTSATPALHQKLLAIDAKNRHELRDVEWLFNDGKWRTADELNDVKRACIYMSTCRYFHGKPQKQVGFWEWAFLWTMPLTWYLFGLLACCIDDPTFFTKPLFKVGSLSWFMDYTFLPCFVPVMMSFDIPLFILPVVIGAFLPSWIIKGIKEKYGYNEKEHEKVDKMTRGGADFHRRAVKNVLCPFIGFDNPMGERRNPAKPPLFYHVFNLRYMKSALKQAE